MRSVFSPFLSFFLGGGVLMCLCVLFVIDCVMLNGSSWGCVCCVGVCVCVLF